MTGSLMCRVLTIGPIVDDRAIWSDSSRSMLPIRTIVAALIAFSVAMLPATGEAIVSPSATQAVMADQSDMPCCPCCNTQHDVKLTTSCVLNCIALAGVVFPTMATIPVYVAGGTPVPFVDGPLHEFLKEPPTHPPPL